MKNNNYDVILFDLDGTLTNPKQGITKSVQYSLASFGIIEENPDNLEKFIGPPLMDSFIEFYGFDDDTAQQAVVKYREYFADKGIFENKVYPMIPELLQQLCKARKDLIVATSKPTVFAERILAHFQLSEYFSLVVGSNLNGTRVKKGEVIAHALKAKGLQPEANIVMVGDRKHDIIGAKQAGINSAGVLYGYGSLEELQSQNPTYIVESVKKLHELFCSD